MATVNKSLEHFTGASPSMTQEAERPDVVEQSNPSESASLPHNEMMANRDTSVSLSPGLVGPVTKETLQNAAQGLIEEINAKRKRDTSLLTDFKKSMEMQVSNSSSMLEQAMFETYERSGTVIQEKLQQLFATLDRISKLEAELEDFRNALGMLYKDVNLDS